MLSRFVTPVLPQLLPTYGGHLMGRARIQKLPGQITNSNRHRPFEPQSILVDLKNELWLIPKYNTPNACCASQLASPCDRTSSLPTLLGSSSHHPLCIGGQSGPSLTPPLACDLVSVSANGYEVPDPSQDDG